MNIKIIFIVNKILQANMEQKSNLMVQRALLIVGVQGIESAEKQQYLRIKLIKRLEINNLLVILINNNHHKSDSTKHLIGLFKFDVRLFWGSWKEAYKG